MENENGLMIELKNENEKLKKENIRMREFINKLKIELINIPKLKTTKRQPNQYDKQIR